MVALGSAEAELYAKVAASAEALAIAAYAHDLGLEMKCELYCDSSAALGITQRAGIGQVRHLRTQGLWVQEVRMSGRTADRKVLGENHPADLSTKHMSAELAGKHLETLNMSLGAGRASSAPTLDLVESYVIGWRDDEVADNHEVNAMQNKAVRFAEEVQVRAISASGRCRRTPKRGSRVHERLGLIRRSRRGRRDSEIDRGADAMSEEVECRCNRLELSCRGDGRQWADMDEDEVCSRCTRSWASGVHGVKCEGMKARYRVRFEEGDDERPVYSIGYSESPGSHSSVRASSELTCLVSVCVCDSVCVDREVREERSLECSPFLSSDAFYLDKDITCECDPCLCSSCLSTSRDDERRRICGGLPSILFNKFDNDHQGECGRNFVRQIPFYHC